MIGSTDDDTLLLEELDENVYLNVRHTKDFRFVTVNAFSPMSSMVLALSSKHFELRKEISF